MVTCMYVSKDTKVSSANTNLLFLLLLFDHLIKLGFASVCLCVLILIKYCVCVCVATPCFLTRTLLWSATPCALHRMRRPLITKPEEECCLCPSICHGQSWLDDALTIQRIQARDTPSEREEETERERKKEKRQRDGHTERQRDREGQRERENKLSSCNCQQRNASVARR